MPRAERAADHGPEFDRRRRSCSGADALPALFAGDEKTGIVWTAEKIDAGLAAPTKVVPGTSMTIMIASAQDRADVIAYLETLMPPAP